MTSEADLVLIHPPSVYDFRRIRKYYGPVSDVVPSDPVFDMYPAGFLSIASYLGKSGYDVRILNVAALMLVKRGLDVERLIARTYAKAYGIDLHWAVHAHGAIELARLVKKYHPDSPVLVGGMTATYYFKELLENYSCVDYVLLGDSTEEPLRLLLSVLESGSEPGEVPNLAYRVGDGLKCTGIRFVPNNLDPYYIDYDWLFSRYVKRKLLLGALPYASFLSRPIGAVLPFKGCVHNCLVCGGSKWAYERFFARTCLAVKSPEVIVRELRGLLENLKIPVFVIGDLRLLGKSAEEFLSLLKKENIDSDIMFEFFTPPPRGLLERLAGIAPNVIVQISPETPSESLRKRIGRLYGNRELVRFVKDAVNLGLRRIDLYFMIGLAGQRPGESRLIARFLEGLVSETGGRGRVVAFVAPLSPFLDPGSIAFEKAPESGYILRARKLEEHRKLLLEPLWWNSLNYETCTMSRRDVALETYKAAVEIVKLNVKWGSISEEEGERVIESATAAMSVVRGETEPPMHRGEEIVRKTYLYPRRELLFSIRPKLALRLMKGLLS